MECLHSSRCLLVLDNVEAVLCSGVGTGQYLEGYSGYGELFRRVGEIPHQSCLVLTSREKPEDLASLEGETLPVRALQLTGLKELEVREIVKAKGLLVTEAETKKLTECYSGNPLALKIVATMIRDVFDSNISKFLAQGTAVFSGIRNLLAQQFNRLSAQEKEIMYWLAINREPISLEELRSDIVSPVTQPKFLDAVSALDGAIAS